MKLPAFDKVFFVHYQCDEFGKGERIHSLSIYAEGKTKNFSESEKEAIVNFYKRIKELNKKGLTLVHWNQDKPHFGPQHIIRRAGKAKIPELERYYDQGINLSWELINEYGDSYEEHNRLDNLADRNKFSGKRSSSVGASSIFAADRVLLLSKIYFNFLRGTLKTNNRATESIRDFKLGLEYYEFDNLEKIKQLSSDERTALIEFLATQTLPYIIAMFYFLGFIEHLQFNYFRSKSALHKEIAKFLNVKNDRDVAGNIRVLSPSSNENRVRYTSHEHVESVRKYYSKLKRTKK